MERYCNFLNIGEVSAREVRAGHIGDEIISLLIAKLRRDVSFEDRTLVLQPNEFIFVLNQNLLSDEQRTAIRLAGVLGNGNSPSTNTHFLCVDTMKVGSGVVIRYYNSLYDDSSSSVVYRLADIVAAEWGCTVDTQRVNVPLQHGTNCALHAVINLYALLLKRKFPSADQIDAFRLDLAAADS